MESLTPQAYEQIIKENRGLICRYCVPQEKWDPCWTDKRHAVDQARQMTFMLIPKFAPHDTLDRYLVTFEGVAFVFEIGGNKVRPIDLPAALMTRLTEIRQAITDAFQLHGVFGIREPRPLDIPSPHFD